jgi:hypothetical protein
MFFLRKSKWVNAKEKQDGYGITFIGELVKNNLLGCDNALLLEVRS